MKKIKKLIPVLLALIIPISSLGAIAAGSEPTEKEEVIYINLGADGELQDIYAVNIFGGGEVTDYGDYSSAEMLNTTDKINMSGDKVAFSSSADRVYYKGKLKNAQMPWNISIKYFLDGKEYTASEVAGKSGSLEIRFKVTKNENCKGNFYDKYALQASFTLDTEKCRDILASDATVANVGAKKQLSYPMLPAKGIDTVIPAEVEDFKMPAVSINGVLLSMNIEVDDKELTDKVNELTDAIKALDSGAGELKDGTKELKDGASALNGGAKDLSSGAKYLSNGAETLNYGVALIGNGLDGLNSKSAELNGGSAQIMGALAQIQRQLSAVSASTEQIDALVNGSAQIKGGITELSQGITELYNGVSFAAYKAAMQQNGLNIDDLQAENTQIINQLYRLTQSDSENAAFYQQLIYLISRNSAAIGGMETYLNGVNGSIARISAGAESLKNNYEELDRGINALANELKGLLVKMTALKGGIDTLVTEYRKLDGGINEYTDGVAKIVAGYNGIISGANDLMTGSKTLASGAATLSDSTSELVNGISELSDGAGELKSGIAEMKEKTDGLDGEIFDKIDDMLESITGGKTQIQSFVSEKNTNVKSVQFVIKTKAVETDDTPVAAPAKEEKLSLWQKILRLFGLY